MLGTRPESRGGETSPGGQRRLSHTASSLSLGGAQRQIGRVTRVEWVRPGVGLAGRQGFERHGREVPGNGESETSSSPTALAGHVGPVRHCMYPQHTPESSAMWVLKK